METHVIAHRQDLRMAINYLKPSISKYRFHHYFCQRRIAPPHLKNKIFVTFFFVYTFLQMTFNLNLHNFVNFMFRIIVLLHHCTFHNLRNVQSVIQKCNA